MTRVNQDAFLNRLEQFLNRTKNTGAGSLVVTMKRYDAAAELAADGAAAGGAGAKKAGKKGAGKDASDFVCLMHARLGKLKVSTLVPYKDHVRFQQQYGLLMKVHADGLKKREKRKSEKERARAAKEKKKKSKPAASPSRK